MAAALTGTVRRHALPIAAAAMAAFLLLGLALTGKRWGLPPIGHVEGQGILPITPADIDTVEIRLGKEVMAFRRRNAETWIFDGAAATELPRDLVAHLETGLRFLHVATPARILAPAEYASTELADYGLDPPAYVVTLGTAGRTTVTADFGTLNPARTSQYARLVGGPSLYLLPRHVGAEWQLTADMAKRVSPPGTASPSLRAGLLLPASIDQVWAVEVVLGGRLHRFERDGTGTWFLHTGQHSHAGSTNVHVADPAQASVIAAALAAFAETQIESVAAAQASARDLDHFGLNRPTIIALLYPQDSSAPLARVEIGTLSDDGFSRYARLQGGGGVVTIAAYQPQHLVDLVKAVGAAP